jgi:sec-independent protein translocase protein TatA
MFGISTWQLLVIAVIVAIVFGTKHLRNSGADIATAVRSFKKANH